MREEMNGEKNEASFSRHLLENDATGRGALTQLMAMSVGNANIMVIACEIYHML